jgi:WD40 repeat protein
LFTADEGKLHLRLYDVRRRNKRARAAIGLPPESSQLPDDIFLEVRTVAWSPDGILLAVGRNDDVAHVYDVRCLERGPMLSMTHETESSQYGITALSWTTETGIRTPSLGLLTGGGDRASMLLIQDSKQV